MAVIQGAAHVLGDRVSTDEHVAIKTRPPETTREQLVQLMFTDIDPDFPGRIKQGDFIVAGEYFGSLSTYDEVIDTMKLAGIAGIIAKSFSYLFFRNAINGGMPAIECDTDGFETGDIVVIDLDAKTVINETKQIRKPITSDYVSTQSIINDGGLIRHLQKHGRFVV